MEKHAIFSTLDPLATIQLIYLGLSEDKEMLALFRTSTIFVYENDDVLGFVGYREHYISWLFVHPTARRKSIGRELLAFALANLEGVATLNVTATNTAARNLYNQFGFITEKEFIGDYQGNSLVVLRLSKGGNG